MMPIKETGSGSNSRQNGGPSSDQNTVQQSAERRNYRHTPHQTQEMETFFQQCSYPDKRQRLQIGEALDLTDDQVKFWFQNRRNQIKAHQNRDEHVGLKAQNDYLKNENLQLKEAINNSVCPNCSTGMQNTLQLSAENSRLREEYQRCLAFISSVAVPLPVRVEPVTSALLPGIEVIGAWKQVAMHLASQYLNELLMMCNTHHPLWTLEIDGSKEILNVVEYFNKMLSWDIPSNQHQTRIEASRGSALVMMDAVKLVEIFCDADKWMEMFPSMVSKANTLQIVEGSSVNLNGSLRLMYAEMQMLSPLVPAREVHFLRYCQQNEDRSWGIVDFPLDSLLEYTYASLSPKCRRKPSGCIIEDWPKYGCSKVTWLEHMEVENTPVHAIISEFVNSGMAFGAAKWLAVLESQCERLYRLTDQNTSDHGVSSPEAKLNLMNLAGRMMRAFSLSLSSSRGQQWMTLSESPEDTLRISTRSATEPGHPIGLILCAASTTRLPYPRLQVFDLLRDIRRRAQIMEVHSSNGNSIHELTNIASGASLPAGNCVSLFRIDHHPMQGPSSSSGIAEYVLQESYSNISESVVAYTTLEMDGAVLGRTDPSTPILPHGFVIVPETETNSTPDSGCLLTIGLQTLASTNPNDNFKLFSAYAFQRQLGNIIRQIQTALSGASINTSTSGSSSVMATVDHL